VCVPERLLVNFFRAGIRLVIAIVIVRVIVSAVSCVFGVFQNAAQK
jgi:hypothetical protein